MEGIKLENKTLQGRTLVGRTLGRTLAGRGLPNRSAREVYEEQQSQYSKNDRYKFKEQYKD